MSGRVCPDCLRWVADQGISLWGHTADDRAAMLAAAHTDHTDSTAAPTGDSEGDQ